VWLSLIESGHNPTIVSPAGALGLWQFMPHSGRMYGLTVDRWVDERRDPARATQAAARFLGDLHRRFGNWELAMGAYNMGYGGMSSAIRKFNTNDYWTLSRLEGGIPWETTLYVPKIFAIAIVMNNREAFGLQNIQPDPPIGFDTILVEPATPLEDVAKAAGVSISSVRDLNLQYVADRTPPAAGEERKRWPVRVPSGSGDQAVARLGKTTTDPAATYRVRFGDRLADVAAELGTTEVALRTLNSLSADEVLEPGTVLLAPGRQAQLVAAAEPEVVVVAAQVTPIASNRRVFFRASSAHSLTEIAAAFGVSVRDLASWNALNEEARLSDGMVLQVVVPKDRDLSSVRYVPDNAARILIAGSKEFHEHFEGLKGKRRVEVVVKDGDTLASVGARFGMSVGSMERVNRKSRSTKLVAGETLVVYTDKPVTGVDSALEPAPLPEIVATLPEALPALPATATR
jgi:membrane-bound lytic murein transglycosylase D